jgi:hypothetical protein
MNKTPLIGWFGFAFVLVYPFAAIIASNFAQVMNDPCLSSHLIITTHLK